MHVIFNRGMKLQLSTVHILFTSLIPELVILRVIFAPMQFMTWFDSDDNNQNQKRGVNVSVQEVM